ncbi:unnamed protein product [Thlaspi arvense]|uniref:RRM domain-containing protein n=1 Tax=Thlaspi arvense TaxID=13288 RepID=A0AAU9SHS2_THLAR|nr:unnamed protein product [Thlaspi arvense]
MASSSQKPAAIANLLGKRNIGFFKDVGEVVRVRLQLNRKSKRVGCGFVEFASADEAKKALEKTNGKSLHDREIFLANKGAPPNINFFKGAAKVVGVRLIVDHKNKHVGCGFLEFTNAIQAKRVSSFVVMMEENHRGKLVGYGFVEFSSANAVKKALEKKNGEYLHDCEIILDVAKIEQHPPRPHIKMFKKVGEVVGVRLIVNQEGKHVGCGFIEFASADEAKKVAIGMNGYSIFLGRTEIAPYPFRPKYNLYKLAKKLWYEDNLRQESLDLKIRPILRTQQAIFCGKKITFSDDTCNDK